MPANATKAQVKKAFNDAGIVQPNLKLEGEELQARMNQRSIRFEDKRTKRNRNRAAQKRNAINSAW